MEPGFITIVGGNGGMGRMLVRMLSGAGYRVAVSDINDTQGPSWAEVGAGDVVILAVPISAMPEVLVELGPHTRTDGLVVDICSLKAEPVAEMLKHCRGEVIGSHPMFGPAVESWNGHTVYYHPARGTTWVGWFKEFVEKMGAQAVEVDPETHDRLMACVQVLRHMMVFSFGLSLARMDFDVMRHVSHSGPWFPQLISMLGNQLEQSPDLFADMAMHNPSTPAVLEQFARAVADVSDHVAAGNRDALLDIIHQVSTHLTPQGRPMGA